jgi:lysophospholipase L1-like esterase
MSKPGLPVLLALAVLAAGAAPAQTKLDTTQFIVVGEGLAAGMADFALRDVYQDKSFGAQMARQMKTLFPQPLIEGAGIGNAPGYTQLPVHLPGTLQGSVRTPFPPYLFVFNLSIPGQRLADSLTRRPVSPLVQQRDPQQTVINLILGYPALIVGKDKPLWTQAEYAVQMNPTFVIVELGYYDVLEPAVKDDPSLLPDVATFRTNLTTLLTRLKATNAEMMVMTIPDPFDTSFFTTLDGATRLVGTPPSSLMSIFKVKQDDLLTPYGLMLIGNLILSKNVAGFSNPLFTSLGAFFPGTVVSAATRTAVRARVTALNTEVVNAAKAVGANTYDLAGLFSRVRAQGLQVGTKTLTADFLGGFYSLDNYYPGAVGHAVIANEVLTQLNQIYKTSFPLLDIAKIAADDPAGRFTPAAVKKPITREESQ